MEKNTVRKDILNSRMSMSKDEVYSKSKEIEKRLFECNFFDSSSFLMAYVDFRNEVKTEDIIKKSLTLGKKVAVPISVPSTKELIVSQVKDFDKELEIGHYNILEPKKEYIRNTDPSIIDLILVPGVAFDRRGYRIGYGAGYYDRFFNKLNKNVPKVALAFDIQIVENIPQGYYDIPVDYIITEKEIISCENKKY